MNLPTRDDVLLRLVAPIGGVTSGVPILIGGMLVIPENTELVNVEFAGLVRGHIYLPKAAEAVAAGDPAYWDNGNACFTKTAAIGLFRCGRFTEAGISGDASAWVLFDGTNIRGKSAFKATTAGLTAGAGATQDVDVTATGATAASVPQVSLNTYAGAGFPQITKVVGGTDKVTVTILNSHVSANLTAAAVLNVTLD